ncbi:hypothetical protein F4780DRAFT_792926 [Xylariomycetidae sp. FL0641]|nr:hypothetical protein F4780DRAFT_792926 [Xylariomycetidae sp. FL0641]
MASLNLDWRNPKVFVPGAAAAYLLLVRALRYRRRDGWIRDYRRKYGACDRAALAQMTLDDAWPVLRDMTELEFPSMFSASVFFALFKTYGIPSISKLLLATGQLAGDTASKRTADTGVLVSEFVLNPPDAERRLRGIARMNYLHERYRRAGKITDPDMLYTLGLFALEPARWTARHDWRAPTDLERAALGTFWRDLGVAMDIPYDALAPYYDGDGEGGGLAWLEALDRWSRRYEEDFMVPADPNEKVAQGTLDIVLFNTPVRWRGFALKLVSALLEDRLRTSMRIPEPGSVHRWLVGALLRLRAWAVRHLHPPRPGWRRQRFITEEEAAGATGRYHAQRYVAHPWYVAPTAGARWASLEALRTRLLWGGVLPGDEGARYHPEGYAIADVGPERQRGRGREEMERTVARLRERRAAAAAGGCPMAAAAVVVERG